MFQLARQTLVDIMSVFHKLEELRNRLLLSRRQNYQISRCNEKIGSGKKSQKREGEHGLD
jgi:hypothetical protein